MLQSEDSPRELVLQQSAMQAARDWTGRWFRTLARDGRRVEGGWPGTIAEARGCVAVDVERALEKQAMLALTRDELTRLTRITYEQARSLWRSGAEKPRR